MANPFNDGLNFVRCPPQPANLRLPRFPAAFKQECNLIRWARCKSDPDGTHKLILKITDFAPDRYTCGVYNGVVSFIDEKTGDWYVGKLKFHYTRNYVYEGPNEQSIAFRFVVKGDLKRVSDVPPENVALILCTHHDLAEKHGVAHYQEIFVYGGFDVLCDPKTYETKGFLLGLGHNDGWYTHHQKCSKRPIDITTTTGDYIGHYCDRGWLFVSPGDNFIFSPNIHPPTGAFTEEAWRGLGKECYTEENVKEGVLEMKHVQCIHSYQALEGVTVCGTPFASVDFCQGVPYTTINQPTPWLTFFSMGGWAPDPPSIDRPLQTLHLVEGNVRFGKGKELYCYGFATRNKPLDDRKPKLVDLASNGDAIGVPVDTELLLYLYDAEGRDPYLKIPVSLDPRATKLMQEKFIKEGRECAFE